MAPSIRRFQSSIVMKKVENIFDAENIPRLSYSLLKTHKDLADKFINSLNAKALEELKTDWTFHARDEQLPPYEWWKGSKYLWILRCGRGWGKTRTAVQTLLFVIASGKYKRISICGATAEEVRDIMIEGESGIASCLPPNIKMRYCPSIKKIYFNDDVIVSLFYGSEPEKSRGAQSEFLWCDEIHKWQYPEETFDNLLMGLRLGSHPLCIVTSTPKPTAFTRRLESLKDKEGNSTVVVTVGSTYSNKDNLSPTFFTTILSKYEGSRLALQELEGQILDDNPNALFKREWIEYNKVNTLPAPYAQERVVVAVDPAVTHSAKTSDATGIVVVLEGRAPSSLKNGSTPSSLEKMHYYVLADGTLIGTPLEWSWRVKTLAEAYGANAIIVEDNQGGDMTESTLLNASVSCPIYRVHATQNKSARAMQASILCEMGRLHFFSNDDRTLGEQLDVLESELTSWVPGDSRSPDRLDALSHAINFLNRDPVLNSEKEEVAKSVIANLFQ